MMPESYPFVPELQKWRKYRGAIIMKNFKIIYFIMKRKISSGWWISGICAKTLVS